MASKKQKHDENLKVQEIICYIFNYFSGRDEGPGSLKPGFAYDEEERTADVKRIPQSNLQGKFIFDEIYRTRGKGQGLRFRLKRYPNLFAYVSGDHQGEFPNDGFWLHYEGEIPIIKSKIRNKHVNKNHKFKVRMIEDIDKLSRQEFIKEIEDQLVKLSDYVNDSFSQEEKRMLKLD